MSETGKKRYGRVWDPLVRLFHWVLVAAFATAWFERSEASIHQTAGKTVLVLIILRTAWGLIGPASARFDTFVKGPVATLKYVFSIFRGKPAHYLGHNPAGAAMIGALLLSLVTTAASGVLMTTTAFWGGEWVEWIHGTAANLTVLLIAGHLIGVIAACFQHKENLPLSMVTGRKYVSVNTERFLGPTMFTKRRVIAAALIAASASAAWAGSSAFFNAGLWRMPKTITAEAKKAGCDVAAVTGPRIVVYPALQLHYDIELIGSESASVASIPARTALERRPKIEIANVAADCQSIAGQHLTESLGAPLVKAAALFASVFPGGQSAASPAKQASPQTAAAPPAGAADSFSLDALAIPQAAGAASAAAAALPIILAPAASSNASEPLDNQGAAPPVRPKRVAEPQKKAASIAKPSKKVDAKPAERKVKKKPQRRSELKVETKRRVAVRAKPKQPGIKRLIKRVRNDFAAVSNSGSGSGSKNSGSDSDNSGSGSDNRGSGSGNSGSGSDNSGSGSNNSGSGGGGGDD